MIGMKKIALMLMIFCAGTIFGQEICDNALDDDGDGLIDLNDPDCDCEDFIGAGGLVPNHSFEETICCDEFDCYEEWENGFGIGAGHLHSTDCGATEAWGVNFDLLVPIPDGEHFISLDNNEFPRMCLDEPLLAGETYYFGVYTASTNIDALDSVELAFFGTPDCADVTFADECPLDAGSWSLLASSLVIHPDPYGWVYTGMVIEPVIDMYGFCVGTTCDYAWGHFFLDNIIISEFGWTAEMYESGGWCTGTKTLAVTIDTVGGSWQWYHNGVALIGETDEILDDPASYGEGDFLAQYIIGDYCERLIYNSPANGFTAEFSTEAPCFPDTVLFDNASLFDPLDDITWYWDYGDGSFSTDFVNNHLYTESGEFEASLMIVSADPSCNDTIEHTVTVTPKPEAIIDFYALGMFVFADHDVVCKNNVFNLIDASTVDDPSEIIEWEWIIDDTVYTEQNPYHFFSDVGIYDIDLIVLTDGGCRDTAHYDDLYVTEIELDFTSTEECVFDEVVFENETEFLSPEAPGTWEWRFGDGGTADTEDAVHAYDVPGVYTVELVVQSNEGCLDSIVNTITVYPLPIAHFEFVVDGISSEDGGTGGCYTHPVQFNSLATIDDPSIIASWYWDFGDGITSTDENPEHLYDSEGIYTVNLTVVSDAGCEHSVSLDILMTNGLAFLSNDTTICQNGIATLFAASSDGSFHLYDWSIPGSDGDAEQTVEGLEEDYWVYVTATNAAGCVSPVDSVLITVLDPITLDISAFDTVCIGELTNPTVIATGGRGDYHYEWTANGSVIGGDVPTIGDSPLMTTEYCVTVSDGCETDPVVICTETYVPEHVVFTSDTTEGCEPTLITFTNLTGPDTTLNQTTWYINGEVLVGNTVSYLFVEAGSYTLALDVLSPEGCVTSNSVYGYITIHPLPTPELYATPNPTTYFNTIVELVNITPNITSDFEWFMPGGDPEFSDSDSLVVVKFPELVSANYNVKLIETTQYGCVDSVETLIIINNDQIIYAPNTFTPDGDQYNQTWGIFIEGVDIYDFHLLMFNRWGEIVWESYNTAGRWDGSYGGNAVQDGVYVWVIHAKDKENDKVYEFKGTVNVLR
jgi:gliding motility-associated-like protein